MSRFTWIVLLIFTCLNARAQFDKNYKPAPFQDTIPSRIATQLKQKLERDKAAVEDPKSQVGLFLKSLYDKRYEYLVKTFNDDLFMVDSELTAYVQSVLDKIYSSNPQLPRETQVYVLRSETPNAMSFGDGTIGFTLGLLARMENEAQVAFVLSHEMAHYHLEHSAKDLKNLARLNYDKDLKRKIDDARKSPYGQYTRMKEVFNSLGFSLTHHSRIHEFEADSLGFVYFSKTPYDLHTPSRVMEILDSASVPRFQDPIDFKKYFDAKAYPFKSSWAAYTKSTTWHVKAEEVDSLKTHPDCKGRIIALERQRLRYAPDATGVLDTRPGDIAYVRMASEFELVESDYHFKQFGKAMFRSLLLLEQFPRNIYLQAMVGKCFYKLYAYQRNHELGKVLELPDPRFADNYDRFLDFLQKLRLMEIASIGYHYVVSRPEECFSDEEFVYALWLNSTLEISKLSPDKVKEEYMEKFPNGRYLKQMK